MPPLDTEIIPLSVIPPQKLDMVAGLAEPVPPTKIPLLAAAIVPLLVIPPKKVHSVAEPE